MAARIGGMDHRVSFEKKVTADDGYGNTKTMSWDLVHRCWAAFRPSFGREQMEAGRLESTRRGVLTIRSSADARSVKPDDRVRFIGGPFDGLEMQIRSIVPTADYSLIEFNCEEGVAL